MRVNSSLLLLTALKFAILFSKQVGRAPILPIPRTAVAYDNMMFRFEPYSLLHTREPGQLIGSPVGDSCFIKVYFGSLLIMGKQIVLILERFCVSQDKTNLSSFLEGEWWWCSEGFLVPRISDLRNAWEAFFLPPVNSLS